MPQGFGEVNRSIKFRAGEKHGHEMKDERGGPPPAPATTARPCEENVRERISPFAGQCPVGSAMSLRHWLIGLASG
jgi:hypothetical protein